jgi:hypothetical protein
MLLTKKAISRRTILRGAGAALALPWLDAMQPALSAASTAPRPRRLAFVYVPNGIIMDHWTPAADGSGFELTPLLEPLAPYRDRLLVLSGLAQKNGRALGDGPGDHARAAASYLTGFHPKKTEGADILNGVSVDQVAAAAIGQNTRFPSLELGLEGGGMVGNCDSGYSCAYSNSLAWKTPTTPLPPEINPRAVFERLFGDGEVLDPQTRAARARQERSILDFVREDAARLAAELGAGDRRKLDEYLTSVREIERRIEIAERATPEQLAAEDPHMPKPAGMPVTFEEHAKVMFDLMTAALQTDSTRVITLMMGREGSNRTYRSIGVPEAHHGLSHHMGNAEKIGKIAKINRLHVELFAYLTGKLASTQDGGATLLDHTMLVYGSGLADGNRHTHHDLPILLAGGAEASIKPGRHIRYKPETPLNNLFLALLDRMGVRTEKLGDSDGVLEHLGELS